MTLAPLTSLGLVHRIPIYSRRANVVMQSTGAGAPATAQRRNLLFGLRHHGADAPVDFHREINLARTCGNHIDWAALLTCYRGYAPPPSPPISGIIELAENSAQNLDVKEFRYQNLGNKELRSRRLAVQQTYHDPGHDR